MGILVGELAKLYGLSSQTLHYYEEKGMLIPYRDTQNGYRYYDVTDLSRLGSIKKYRNANFSLGEGIELYQNSDGNEVAYQYQKQREKIWEEIQQKQYLLMQLDEHLSLYNRYHQVGNKFYEQEYDWFVRFESKEAQVIFQDSNTRKEATPWFKNILYTVPSYMYYYDEKTMEINNITYGMMASKSIAKYLDLEVTDNVSIIEGGLFLTSVMNTEKDGTLSEYIKKCFTYINENGYKLRGNPFARTIFIFNDKDGEKKSYNIFFLPVKKLK